MQPDLLNDAGWWNTHCGSTSSTRSSTRPSRRRRGGRTVEQVVREIVARHGLAGDVGQSVAQTFTTAHSSGTASIAHVQGGRGAAQLHRSLVVGLRACRPSVRRQSRVAGYRHSRWLLTAACVGAGPVFWPRGHACSAHRPSSRSATAGPAASRLTGTPPSVTRALTAPLVRDALVVGNAHGVPELAQVCGDARAQSSGGRGGMTGYSGHAGVLYDVGLRSAERRVPSSAATEAVVDGREGVGQQAAADQRAPAGGHEPSLARRALVVRADRHCDAAPAAPQR